MARAARWMALTGVVIAAPALAAPTLPGRDLSLGGMFLAADPVVKAVMALLLTASLATWTIFAAKLVQIRTARKALAADLQVLDQAATINEARLVRHPAVVAMIALAERDIDRSADLAAPGAAEGLKARYATRLQVATTRAVGAITPGLSVLASIGSTGPFVGLAGTVWGIMNSFIGIAKSHSTSLAVVAPGIAEALLATAMGLAAAIPAVLFYNVLARQLAAFRREVGEAAALASCVLSLELETRLLGLQARSADPDAAGQRPPTGD